MSCARSCVGGVDIFMMGYLAICFVLFCWKTFLLHGMIYLRVRIVEVHKY